MIKSKTIPIENIDDILGRMVEEIVKTREANVNTLAVIGIKTGGATLAQKLVRMLTKKTGIEHPLGLLDITLYRDDIGESFPQPVVKTTEVDFDVSGKEIVLIDDVIFTGRTIRAALDSIMDLGRPSGITLAVMVDRGHRELPIQPDITGLYIDTKYGDRIEVLFEESGKPTKLNFISKTILD